MSYDNRYGELSFGGGKKVNLEFVSANPTGPLHVGHCRGAILGDVISNLLSSITAVIVPCSIPDS